MFEIRHLVLVDAIDRHGTLKRAAQELHLSPSALSHQLKQLESTLGIPVFHRSGGQLHFTALGRELCEAARTILGQVKEIEERVDTYKTTQADRYIHGYSATETQRLYDQAHSIADFIHWDSHWESGAHILEAGCGVGAQTQTIARQNPTCTFVGVDLSQKSLEVAAELVKDLKLSNVELQREDLTRLSFPRHHFDHVFVCFVLEHVPAPRDILRELWRVLRPGGTITVVEGDHGSTYFHPDSAYARQVVAAQVELQAQNGGDANIGRQLYPLLREVGFAEVGVSPRQIYVDDSKPALVQGFTRDTFTAMIRGIAEEVYAKKLLPEHEFQRGIRDLERTAAGGGTFCYTFFKGVAIKPKEET